MSKRDPARDAAKKLFLDSGGKLTTQQVADAVGKSAAVISKWRRLDDWKKRGCDKQMAAAG